MALPASWDTRTIKGKRLDFLGQPAVGKLIFSPTAPRIKSNADKSIIFAKSREVTLDSEGAFSITLPVSVGDVDVTPYFQYDVIEQLVGAPDYKYTIEINLSLPAEEPFDISDLIAVGSVPTGTTALTKAVADTLYATKGTSPDLGGAAALDVGTAAGTVAAGDDSRIIGAAQKAANLSDLADHPTARTNLGLGNSATRPVGTSAGSVAAGDDSRITGAAQKASNLSDLANISTARTNLGLGGAALLPVGTATNTVAAGDDARLVGAMQKSANLSDVANASSARSNLGLGGSAILNVGIATGTVAAGDDSRIVGAVQKSQNLSDLPSVSTARLNLGLGGAALLNVGTTAGTVAAGDDSRISGAAQKSANLSDIASSAIARTNLGLGTASVRDVGTVAGTVAAGDDSRIVGAIQDSAVDERIRDVVGATLIPGANISIVVDDAGNTITISTAGSESNYKVFVTGADNTGVSACDTAVSTACSSVVSLVSSVTGAVSACTVTLVFSPGKYKFITDTAFNTLLIAPSTMRRGVCIEGSSTQGKRNTLLSFESTATATTDQRRNNLMTFVNLRQVWVRNLGFRSTNSAQTLWYLFCSVTSDDTFPEFDGGANNCYRFEGIWLEGSWKTIWGADGDTRANQNSEIRFSDFTTSNSLSVTDYIFRFGYPLYSAVFIATNSSPPSSGTWTFTYNGQTTAALDYNITAANLQTAVTGLSSVGAGNATVSGNNTSGYIVRFTGTLLGTNTALASVTSSVSPVSFKCYRYTPQQSQFLNYHFMDNEFEYGDGDFMLLNMGGFVSFTGYHSMISGIGGGTTGGCWFTMENISGRADDMAHLAVRDARFEFRTKYCKLIDSYWNDVNKFIIFDNVGTCATFTTGRDSMETIALRSATPAMCQARFTMMDLPGYVTLSTTGSAAGGTVIFEQMRFKSSTMSTTAACHAKYANQTDLAAATNVSIRVLGGATFTYRGVVGATGYRVTDATVSL